MKGLARLTLYLSTSATIADNTTLKTINKVELRKLLWFLLIYPRRNKMIGIPIARIYAEPVIPLKKVSSEVNRDWFIFLNIRKSHSLKVDIIEITR